MLTPGGAQPRSASLPVDDGDALVVATSGTTGEPRGVVLTHGAVAASARATSARLQVDPSHHRWLSCLPLNHIGGLSVVTRSLLTGTPLTVLPGFDETRCSPVRALTSWWRWCPPRWPGSTQRSFFKVLLGGSAPPPRVPQNVVTSYGMTETGSGVVYDGVPLDGVEVSVGSGEVRLRGPDALALVPGRHGTSRRGGVVLDWRRGHAR